MMRIHEQLQPADLLRPIRRLWELSAAKIDSIKKSCPPGTASPVFTRNGRYAARGWTEWTQGFAYGSAILQFDATGDQAFLQLVQQFQETEGFRQVDVQRVAMIAAKAGVVAVPRK